RTRALRGASGFSGWDYSRGDPPGPAAQSYRKLDNDSVPGVPGSAREWNRVAHVGEPGNVRHGALEAETEPGMRHRPVAAQVAIPAVVVLVETGLRHARIEDVEPLLALAAADDLADPGGEDVHRGDGL